MHADGKQWKVYLISLTVIGLQLSVTDTGGSSAVLADPSDDCRWYDPLWQTLMLKDKNMFEIIFKFLFL
jgi:hypothetical protein